MTFQKATDALMENGVTQREIAAALGVSLALIRQNRIDPASPNFRNPPIGWRPKLAELARRRGAALSRLAEKLGGD